MSNSVKLLSQKNIATYDCIKPRLIFVLGACKSCNNKEKFKLLTFFDVEWRKKY